MSSIKEYLFDLQEQRKENWIRKQLNNDDADEKTEGWYELAESYDLMVQNKEDAEEFEYELKWHSTKTHKDLHAHFVNEINKIKYLIDIQVPTSYEDCYFKMIYVHAVTILETFLGDIVKHLIISDEKYLINALTSIDEVKKTKFTLLEILNEKEAVRGITLKLLSNILYHNIPKVKKILELILKNSLRLDLNKINQVISFRHDIVHRNGKNINNIPIIINKNIILEAVNAIENFAEAIQASMPC